MALALENLAVLYDDEGRHDQAEQLYLRSVAIKEKVLGPAHPDLAMSLFNLGTLYARKGDPARAEPLLLRSLGIFEKAMGPEHPDTEETRYTLAKLYAREGRKEPAMALLRKVFPVGSKLPWLRDLDKEPDFAGLHGNGEFRKMVAELGQPVPKNQAR